MSYEGGVGVKILDACCGSRMFWFNRTNKNVTFMDNRELETELCDGRKLVVKPDIVAISSDGVHEFNSLVEYFSEDGYPAFDIKVPSTYYFDSNVFSEVLMSGFYEIEIIGNIHENLELLEVAE